MPTVRLVDVAERAGVSIKTVSNVVHDHPYVRAELRARVQAAIDELGYRPNVTARRLATGRTGTISIAVPSIDVPYFGEICQALDRRLRAHELRSAIEQTLADRDAESAVLEQREQGLVDGVIFHPVALTPEDLADRQAGFPMVLIGEGPAPASIDHVMIDNVVAAQQATASLLSAGRRRIAFLGYNRPKPSETTGQRLRGYQQAIHAAGLKLDRKLYLRVDNYAPESGRLAVHEATERGIDFDGIVCRDDLLALGALHGLAELGRRVPDDVAVIGWDDLAIAAHLTPPLTSIAPDKEAIARRATQLLLERMNGYHGPGRHEIVGHRLIVRGSSGADRP
ncbi:LacI family transcriptional regulator [Microlunatus elymi]|uniref:LacI family transcriptional regulator n=1 Tax=Microlunatus elymi TaxID=2596828 RepID=A0A516PZG1_9ACTN|nr:LacI family DNA-binding transcriptional regulator [Microlunatus elymi]QDP96537.1 LacI family transcriptional regulator [Microlunatus elymi]